MSALARLSLSLIHLLLLVTVHAASGEQPSISDTVDLGYATYQGTVLQDAGITQFLGMRFAAPPVGSSRWRAPQPPLQETGIVSAKQYGASCIGVGKALSDTAKEDCLFLSVYAPTNATQSSNLPVWFFIQGGGYAANSDATVNASALLAASGNQMVFVEINYRVGVFGFLASKKVQANGDLNAGLLDQKAALAWVQKYIYLVSGHPPLPWPWLTSQFGGNPNHVVLHGASAGAGSVALHLTAYGGKGSSPGIVGAIMESPFVPTHRTVAGSEFQFDRLVLQLGCQESQDQLACLRSKDSAALQAQNFVQSVPGAPARTLPNWYWLPVVDGNFSQRLLSTHLDRGQFRRVPVLVGNDNDEGTNFTPALNGSTDFRNFIKANYPKLTSQDLDSVAQAYPLAEASVFPKRTAWFGPGEKAYGESTFICFGNRISQAFASFVGPDKVWNYHFNVTVDTLAAKGLGIPHVAEKPAIFGPANQNSPGGSFNTYNAPIVPVIRNYFVSFVRQLDPNPYKYSQAPVWESLGDQGSRRFNFQLDDSRMDAIPSEQQARCDLWRGMAGRSNQ